MTPRNYTRSETKKCSDCKLPLPLSDYYYNAKRNSYFKRCKTCQAIWKNTTYRTPKSKTPTVWLGVQGYIYFIIAPQVNLIKIGFTKRNVNKRLHELSGQSPVAVELILSIPGTTQVESKLHKQFSEFNHHGEWFEYSSSLQQYITDNMKHSATFDKGRF